MSHYDRHSKNYDGKGFKYNGNAVMDTAWISKQIKNNHRTTIQKTISKSNRQYTADTETVVSLARPEH